MAVPRYRNVKVMKTGGPGAGLRDGGPAFAFQGSLSNATRAAHQRERASVSASGCPTHSNGGMPAGISATIACPSRPKAEQALVLVRLAGCTVGSGALSHVRARESEEATTARHRRACHQPTHTFTLMSPSIPMTRHIPISTR